MLTCKGWQNLGIPPQNKKFKPPLRVLWPHLGYFRFWIISYLAKSGQPTLVDWQTVGAPQMNDTIWVHPKSLHHDPSNVF